jgi:hypothetical protein
MGTLTAMTGYQEEERMQTVNRIGYALLSAFIFPLYVPGILGASLEFPNITMLGRGGFLITLGLLYPLLAGGVVLWAGRKIETLLRPVILLATGLFPFLISFLSTRDFMTSSIMRYANEGTIITILFILSLIGVYVGSKLVSVTDHLNCRLIGGISGIVFLAVVLLPVSKDTVPIYFSIFKLFKATGDLPLPGSAVFMALALLVIFTAYILASIIAVINLSNGPNAQVTAVNSYKLVLYATLAFPVSIVLVVLFSGGGGGGVKFSILTMLIKITLWLGGIIGLIAAALWDLLDQTLPKPVKGSDLLGFSRQPAREEAASPPSMYPQQPAAAPEPGEALPNIYQGEPFTPQQPGDSPPPPVPPQPGFPPEPDEPLPNIYQGPPDAPEDAPSSK